MAKALDFPDKTISYAPHCFLASWVAVLSLRNVLWFHHVFHPLGRSAAPQALF